MRKLVMILALVQIGLGAVVLFQAFTVSSDAAGEGMAQGFGIIAFAASLLFNLPALLLAWIEKYLNFALVLTLIFPAFAAWAIWENVI